MSKTVSSAVKKAKQDFCAMCGRKDDLQYHHVRRPLHGGENEAKNIIVLCSECHHVFMHEQKSWAHNETVREGIAAAKKRGIHVGRKPKDAEPIIRLIAEHSTQFNPASLVTEKEIMQMAGIKPVCYYKYKRKLFEAMAAAVWPFSWPKPKIVSAHPQYEHVIRKIRGEGR